jgi:hypothetical protein
MRRATIRYTPKCGVMVLLKISGKSPTAVICLHISEREPGIAGVSPAVATQRIIGTALPMDALET